jgi:hypothetical protein
MAFHARLQAAGLPALIALGLTASPARAGLLNASATVVVSYYNGTFSNRIDVLETFPISFTPTSLATPVMHENDMFGLAVLVGDKQIRLTNLLSGVPFCLANVVGQACTDAFNGVDFLFTGEDIAGVTVNPASGPAFLPVQGVFQGNSHLGLQLVSNNEIRVDLTGDLPLAQDPLILDLSFTSVTPPATVPEPATMAVLASAFAALTTVRRKSKR